MFNQIFYTVVGVILIAYSLLWITLMDRHFKHYANNAVSWWILIAVGYAIIALLSYGIYMINLS